MPSVRQAQSLFLPGAKVTANARKLNTRMSSRASNQAPAGSALDKTSSPKAPCRKTLRSGKANFYLFLTKRKNSVRSLLAEEKFGNTVGKCMLELVCPLELAARAELMPCFPLLPPC